MGFFDSIIGGQGADSAFESHEIICAIRTNDIRRLTRAISDNGMTLLDFEGHLNRIDSDGHTFLSRLLKEGKGEFAKVVMNFGARLDIVLPNRKLVSDLNADNSIAAYLNAISFILSENIGINDVVALSPNQVPHTPVTWMTKLGYYYGLKKLLERGADPNRCYSNSVTPLMIATEMSYPHFIDLLVRHGASPNQADEDGWTPLLFAAANIDHSMNNLVPSAKALIRNGADINHRNNRGQTPLNVALRYGNEPVAAILKNAGASYS